MATSAAVNSPTTHENAERNLQPFFVLHKASPRISKRKSTERIRTKTRTRRRIDLTPSSPKSSEQSDTVAGEHDDDHRYHHLRTNAFHYVWSKIESTVKDVLRNINAKVFNDIHCWVQESFYATRSVGIPDRSKATRSYPLLTYPLSKRLYTGLVSTQNMEWVDDHLTFKDLGQHLKSHGCHVANLSSFDFSAKYGIDGCLRCLLRQFLSLDAADVSILASWYSDQGNYDKPVVVIIEDMERCCGSVLSDFVLMLSEWVVKIPIILIVGVATTVDALRIILPTHALQNLSCHKFILGSPAERMDAIIEAVFVTQCSGFNIGHKVAIFLRNYFLRQDGTLTSFVRALKIAIVQHISMEPLSFILKGLFNEDCQDLCSEKPVFLPEMVFKWAFDLPSCRRIELTGPNEETLAHSLSDLKIWQKSWSSVVMALLGDPRRTIQSDLLEFHKFLKCNCCSKSGNILVPSMHDTSILYMLTQEHGDLINLHDWYQSFKATVLHPRIKGKHRLKQSPSPKNRKDTNESQNNSEASVQAQFCRAVTELQVTGLLRMPSKRRPDYVQRVAFGL